MACVIWGLFGITPINNSQLVKCREQLVVGCSTINRTSEFVSFCKVPGTVMGKDQKYCKCHRSNRKPVKHGPLNRRGAKRSWAHRICAFLHKTKPLGTQYGRDWLINPVCVLRKDWELMPARERRGLLFFFLCFLGVWPLEGWPCSSGKPGTLCRWQNTLGSVS